MLKKLAQASDNHNDEQHNEENEEEHAKEDTSEPNDEQYDKEDKKSEEEQHAKDGKSSDDMSISEEPAAKKKKGSNSEENTAKREDGEDPIEKCKELMTYFGERAKYDKLEIDIDELFDDLKPVYDDIRELNEQIGELRKKQDKLTEVDKLLRAADKLSHDNGLDYLFDGGFDQKLQDSNDARVKLREEAAGLFGELRGKCVLVDAEQKKIEDELRRRSRTYDRELGLKYRSTPEEIAVRAMRDRLTQQQGGGERSPPIKRDDTFHSESIDRIVALQEEQAVRQREIDRLKQAEQARIFGGISLGGGGGASTASAPMSTSNNNFNQFSQTSTSNTLGGVGGNSGGGSMNQAVLAEEMAIRERLHRRMMEEEADAIKQQNFRQHRAHHHKNSMVVAEREHLNRLLQLQQMSDEDLIRHAAEVRASPTESLTLILPSVAY